MSFVGEPFRHDIFISYSHGDPKGTGDSNLRQWSQKFWEELKRDLASYEDLGDLDIFFDASARSGDGVDPFDPLDKHLQEKAAASAMLLTLVSPYYMLSKYCGLERQWWAEGQTAHGFEARGRIAPALVWGIPQSGKADWPTALKEIGLEQTGVRFFDAARAKINPKPFGWPGIGERIADPKFHEALQTLVTHLRVHLLDFQARVRERNIAPAALLSGGEKPAIYLHGRSDNARKWDEACESLLSEGYPVFPEKPEPVETDPAKRREIREQRVNTMAACDALLMLAPEDPSIFSEELMILGKADRGLAIDRAEREFGQAGKQLPGAVVDAVTDPDRARRRAIQARNTRLGWISLADPLWVGNASAWLQEQAR